MRFPTCQKTVCNLLTECVNACISVCVSTCVCVDMCVPDSLLLSVCLSPHRHTNQCYTSHEFGSSQAVTRRPLKDIFIMLPYSDLAGQKSTMLKPIPFNQGVYWSIAGMGWWCWEYTCLSVSNKYPPLAWQQMKSLVHARTHTHTGIFTSLRFNMWRYHTRAPTGESCTLPSCVPLPACLSLERDSLMREWCERSWNHLNFKCMRWLCQWISPVTYCGII